jgi:NADPH:quinone reductase-like Zn-dependent oxidoreductase
MDGAIATGMLKAMVEHEYPITLGRDFAGTVEAASGGVTSVGAGDEVFGAVPAMSSTIHAGYLWLREGVTREQIVEALRPLLALPVEHCSSRTAGRTIAALERALS